jgi:hypothetical protein
MHKPKTHSRDGKIQEKQALQKAEKSVVNHKIFFCLKTESYLHKCFLFALSPYGEINSANLCANRDAYLHRKTSFGSSEALYFAPARKTFPNLSSRRQTKSTSKQQDADFQRHRRASAAAGSFPAASPYQRSTKSQRPASFSAKQLVFASRKRNRITSVLL